MRGLSDPDRAIQPEAYKTIYFFFYSSFTYYTMWMPGPHSKRSPSRESNPSFLHGRRSPQYHPIPSSRCDDISILCSIIAQHDNITLVFCLPLYMKNVIRRWSPNSSMKNTFLSKFAALMSFRIYEPEIRYTCYPTHQIAHFWFQYKNNLCKFQIWQLV